MSTDQELRITGSLIQAYDICPRQAWLMSRNIIGDQEQDHLAIGRLISEDCYGREKKEIEFAGNKFDFIRKDNGVLTVVEVKKSSKTLKATRYQLLFYLYSLKDAVDVLAGEIRIPKEKKMVPVPFDDESVQEIESFIKSITQLLSAPTPPYPKKIRFCKTCSFQEFCFS